MFSETSLGEELGSPCQPGMSRASKTAHKTMALEDVEALHQHIQDLKAQLLNANKMIHSLQRRARSISVTSGYTSGAERPLPAPKALASPSHSLTDEDEGWQSDGHGTLCPPALRAHRDLQSLVHRVALLEAQLPAAKHGASLPKELQSATWPGYGPWGWEIRGFPGVARGWWLLVARFPCRQIPGVFVWWGRVPAVDDAHTPSTALYPCCVLRRSGCPVNTLLAHLS